MGVYLRAKFEVSSIILTSFRHGVILPPDYQGYQLSGNKDNLTGKSLCMTDNSPMLESIDDQAIILYENI